MPHVVCSFLLAMIVTQAQADFSLVKEGRASITLTFFENQTAAIVDHRRKGPLVEGSTMLDDNGTLVIHRAEGEACPDVKVRFTPDLFRGDQATADVTIAVDASSTPPGCEIADIEGRYRKP